MLEKAVEMALVREAQKHDVLCWKFVSPSCAGVADRILIGKSGKVGFVELKRPGGKPTPLQARFAAQMIARGVSYSLADTPDKARAAVHTFLLT